MKTYEIINPSDAVTITAENEAHACAAVLLLSEGAFGLKREDGESVLPMFMFGGDPDKWFQENHKISFGDILKQTNDIAAVLETAATCSLSKRRMYDLALAAITEDDRRKAFITDWDDQNRSSMNAIATKAHRLAARLRETQRPALGDAAPIMFVS